MKGKTKCPTFQNALNSSLPVNTKRLTFQNALNSSLPVDQYACEELVKTYQDTMRTLLLPEMNNMYKTHCNKLDNALKEWIADYTSSEKTEIYNNGITIHS